MRWLIFLHRYLGIGIGWLIVVWCVSGVVMMYVPYPSVSFEEHVEALPALDLQGCCRLDPGIFPLYLDPGGFSIETMLGEPVLTASAGFGGSWRLGLESGQPIGPISAEQAVAIADERTAHWPGRGPVDYVDATIVDQWTVGYYEPGRTLHRLALNDDRHSQWYIDDGNGELIQATTGVERTWNWVGSVAHWLYPTVLRRNGPVWSSVVIWTSVLGLFLTTVGIYIGIARIRYRGGRFSPYRGVHLWHHYVGLACGLVTLTWLSSGLLSMNPWGLLIGSGARTETGRLQDTSLDDAQWLDFFARLGQLELDGDTTYLRAAPFRGRLFLIAYDRAGTPRRYDTHSMQPAPLDIAALERAAAELRPDAPVRSAQLIDGPDAYYYEHHNARSWPVFRIEYDDPEKTRYYLDPVTGELLGKVDGTARAYRWLFNALHSLDFASILRQRPIWDALMVLLLGGVAVVSATGVYMGFRTLSRRA